MNKTSFPMAKHSFVFSFENDRNAALLNNVAENYSYISYAVCILYLSSIFLLQRWMRNQSAHPLKHIAILWNLFLFVLNALATIRLIPFFSMNLWKSGFYSSVCLEYSAALQDHVFCFWISFFPFMKIVELGDTFLIVLQKRSLATYYWTHHSGALLFTWYLYPFKMPILAWFAILINAKHIPIYLYGTLKMMAFAVPKSFSTGLMLSEVMHMLYGMILCSYAYYILTSGGFCSTSMSNIYVCIFMYTFCFLQAAYLLYKRLTKKSRQMPPGDDKTPKLQHDLRMSKKHA